jgi:hypothetical protein
MGAEIEILHFLHFETRAFAVKNAIFGPTPASKEAQAL